MQHTTWNLREIHTTTKCITCLENFFPFNSCSISESPISSDRAPFLSPSKSEPLFNPSALLGPAISLVLDIPFCKDECRTSLRFEMQKHRLKLHACAPKETITTVLILMSWIKGQSDLWNRIWRYYISTKYNPYGKSLTFRSQWSSSPVAFCSVSVCHSSVPE